MEEERVIMTSRESPISLGCWVKVLFTLGLYLVPWLMKKLIVTNRRVTWKSGVFGGNERTIPLNRVTDIAVSRGLFGRMLGYGNIRIESAGGGGTEIAASGIQKPNQVQEEILKHTS